MLIQWIVDGLQGDAQQGYSSSLASHRYRCILPATGLKKLGLDVEYMGCNDWLRNHSKQTAGAIIVAKRLPSLNNLNSFIDQNAKFLEQLQLKKQQGTPILVDVNDDHFNSPQSAIADYWQNLVRIADLVITGSSTMAERVKQFSNSPTIVIEDPLESTAGEIRIFQRPTAGQALLQNLVSRRGWFNQRLQLVWYGSAVNWPDLAASIPNLTTLANDLAFTLKIITTPTSEILAFIKGYNSHGNSNAQLELVEWKQDTVWQEASEAHIVLLPSNLADRKKTVKTANRLVEALNIGRFVVAHPVPAYQQLEDYVWLGEQLADGVRWALDNPKLVEQKIYNGQIQVKNQFSIETIAQKWKGAIDSVNQNSTTATPIAPPQIPREVASDTIRKLNLGCGDKILPGYINVDIAASRNSNLKNSHIEDIGAAYLNWYFDNNVWKIMRYHGIRTLKLPSDMWNYQEIIFDHDIDWVVETGTRHGGSALFFAHALRSKQSAGHVITIDIDRDSRQIDSHADIEFLIGDSAATEIIDYVDHIIGEERGKVFLILDSDHSRNHVYRELCAWVPWLRTGDYLVIEDSCVNGHPVRPEHGPGPWEAVFDYLHNYPNLLIHDKKREQKFGVTVAPNGYFIRL